MNLQLAIVQSCTETTGTVHDIASDSQIEAIFAAPIIEYGITIRPEHLVAVDHSVSPPEIVFRWNVATAMRVADGQVHVRTAEGNEQAAELLPDIDVTVNAGDCIYIIDGMIYDVATNGRPANPRQVCRVGFPMIEAMYAQVVHVDASTVKSVVRTSYDTIADEFLAWTQQVRVAERERYTTTLLDRLDANAQVLELGCGAGLPTTKRLTERFQVTGVDISSRQIEFARQHVPTAKFIRADMMELTFPSARFDAVTAFYSIVHVPREEQPQLLPNIHTWLRPKGLLVAALGASAQHAGYEDDWLGAPMYWSSFDAETNRQMVEDARFQIISAVEETVMEDGDEVTFLWVIARKP